MHSTSHTVSSQTQWSSAFLIAALIMGVAVGSIITWALLFGSLDNIAPWVGLGTQATLYVLMGIAITLLLIAPVLVLALHKFVGRSRGTLETVVKETGEASRAIAARDVPNAVRHIEGAALEVLAWYGPVAVRRWAVQAVAALLVIVGGLVGTALLFRQIVLLDEQNKKLQEQTGLLREQNSKIDLQTVTAEAQRRSLLATELFALLQAVSAKRTAPDGGTAAQIDQILRARIVAFSRAATPYWTVELVGAPTGQPRVPGLARRARSPERGQLLVGLVAAGVDLQELPEAVFDSADLRRAPLKGAKLAGVRLNRADLSHAELHGADLRGTEMAFSDLTFAILEGALFNDETIFDLAMVAPDQSRASSGVPFAWSVLPEKYLMELRDNVWILRRNGPPPQRLPYIYPE